MPTTFPLRLEHNPSFGNFPGANNEVVYGEGVYVGYRWYESRHLPVRFPFGHGLSYTTFEIETPSLSSATFASGDALTVHVPVTNTVTRAGTHVVQCYVAPPPSGLDRPESELRAFGKVVLEPGERTVVALNLDARSFSYWDPGDPTWPVVREKLANPLVALPFNGLLHGLLRSYKAQIVGLERWEDFVALFRYLHATRNYAESTRNSLMVASASGARPAAHRKLASASLASTDDGANAMA